MTKFILHGGATLEPLPGNKQFFVEMVKGLAEPVKVLLVYFARGQSRWPEAFEEDEGNFKNSTPGLDMEFIIADPDPKKFAELVKKAGVIYFRGGRTAMLQEVLKHALNFKELPDRKIYGGESAGANVLAKYYYSGENQAIKEGLGILPIKVITHYDESKQDKLEELKKTGEDLPVYALREGEYQILEK